MKKCAFQSVSILSIKERTAKKVMFDPQMTVIRGGNGHGKSSLLKTIYRTFGTEPAQLHPKWKAAEPRSLVRFTIDGECFAMLRNGALYSVFDGDDRVIFTGNSVGKELAPFLSNLLNFHLQLQSKSSNESQALPAFLFLPFYLDQDSSWTKNWTGFSRLQQFSSWRRDVAEYHMGVRPNEYYHAKSGLLKVRARLREQYDKREILQLVLKELKSAVHKSDFNLDLEVYRQEIEELLVACSGLQTREETLKRDLTKLFNGKVAVEAQISITTAASNELQKDYVFAAHAIPTDNIECPTCGTEHHNSFGERFSIARDEQRCNELLVELRGELLDYETKILGLKSRYSDVSVELDQLRAILNKKQGDVTLQEIIQSEGKKEAREVIQRDIDRVNQAVGQIDEEIEKLEFRMKQFEDKERRKRIRLKYLSSMDDFLGQLDVQNLNEQSYRSLDSNIKETGSELPRALLAYYFAVLHRIFENESATVFPIVIDSPREKDQDLNNWIRILNFIRGNRPVGSQTIVSLVDNKDIDLGGTTVDLPTKGSLLDAAEYDDVSAEMIPLINASNAAA